MHSYIVRNLTLNLISNQRVFLYSVLYVQSFLHACLVLANFKFFPPKTLHTSTRLQSYIFNYTTNGKNALYFLNSELHFLDTLLSFLRLAQSSRDWEKKRRFSKQFLDFSLLHSYHCRNNFSFNHF